MNNGTDAQVRNELGYQLDDPVGFDDPDTFAAWVEDESLIFADEANDRLYVWVEAHHPELDARVISTPHDLSTFCADWRRVLAIAQLDAILAEAEAAAKAVTK